MIDRLESLLVGFAGLFEIVLLLLLSQPINRAQVAAWLKWLVGGALLYHLGYFFRLLLQNERTTSALLFDRVAMGVLCVGLLLMPSAMLHAALRLRQFSPTRTTLVDKADWRYGLLYLPLLALVFAIKLILQGPKGDFIGSIEPLKLIYLGWLAIANLISAFLFFRVGTSLSDRVAKEFFVAISGLLILLTLGSIVYGVGSIGTRWEPVCRLAIGVSPLVPAVVFVWFTLKSRLLPVIFEQSIVYGGMVLLALLFHRLVVTPITLAMRERFDIDFIIIEVLIVATLVWWIRPLRKRAGESLRFLLSPNAFRIRDTTRKLALEVAQQSALSIDARCDWFAQQLRDRFELRWVRVVTRLNDLDSNKIQCFDAGIEPVGNRLASIGSLLSYSKSAIKPLERGEVSLPTIAAEMESLQCDVAFPMQFKSIDGVVLFGSRRRFDRLADEQIISLSVLIDQFAATLQNHRDDELRRQAERRGLQHEKLSTLGLISGSLAHELRNPLSSIRTIASLVSEDLDQENPNQHDLRLIVSEVDRLNQTLQRMLDFAKPSVSDNCEIEPDRVISRLLAIMDYYAKERRIELDIQLNAPNVCVSASDAAMNEIFMNLIKNAMEAATNCENALVRVESEKVNAFYRVKITDNGVGIAADRVGTIFLPFETSKASGTGLGLYIVSERLREFSGTIRVESQIGRGSTFIVELPTEESESD